jgi:hypothetical protein
VRCDREIIDRAEWIDTLEHMHGWCFHLEYEHSGDVDTPCGVHCLLWEFGQIRQLAADRGLLVPPDLEECIRDWHRHVEQEHPGDPDLPCGEPCLLSQLDRLRRQAAERGVDVEAYVQAAREEAWNRSAPVRAETPGMADGARPCPACGKPVPPPGGRCPHCKAWRPDVARDRALYHGFTALTLALAVTRWIVSTPDGLPLFRPGLWREFVHPLVTVPLALAFLFAIRVLRKTGFAHSRRRQAPPTE